MLDLLSPGPGFDSWSGCLSSGYYYDGWLFVDK